MKRALALLLLLFVPFTACAGKESSGLLDKDTLRIGVKYDQPALGFETKPGTFEGFDIDVANYIAKKLGADVEFVRLSSSEREPFLKERKVDLVIATYSITAQRKTEVIFAGPYYVAHQDILVRKENTSIKGLRDLEGKRLCKTEGSNSWRRVVEERGIDAQLVPAKAYGECFQLFAEDRIDAVTTDDLILAGFVLGKPDFKLLNTKFTDEKMGIGIHKDDVAGCEAVNRAVTEMYQDGMATHMLQRWFAPTGLKVTTTVPQFEGCS